jgi:hypothetical protein
MGRIVSLALAYKHLRLDEGNDEEELVEFYLDGAESHVESRLRRPLLPWSATDPNAQVPAAVRQAILLALGDLYENRSAQAEGSRALTENRTLGNLLAPHRRGLGI